MSSSNQNPSANPYTGNLDHVVNYITKSSIDWVASISNAQTVTAGLNNVIAEELMNLYDIENDTLNNIIKSLNGHINGTGGYKKWTSKSISYQIQTLGMQMTTTQKEWDNRINQVQTTAQQGTSQMSAQGNDANQATTSAGLVANWMQTINSLLMSAL